MGNVGCSEATNTEGIQKSEHIEFVLQDKLHRVKASDFTPEMSLNQYLREKVRLVGTKFMCLEGGCGACTVVITTEDPITGSDVTLSVNSCLVSIFSCHGLKITTVEGIGDPLKGFHKIQKTLAEFNGTQCGYCSPGMVMNMYALCENGKTTMKEVEDSFGGNICRCTGYRPILSAFKSICTDADTEILGTFPDIEDLKICPNTNKKCEKGFHNEYIFSDKPQYFELVGSIWIKLYTVSDILDIFIKFPNSTYELVAGNTARGNKLLITLRTSTSKINFVQNLQGVYRRKAIPDIYIDISSVKELKRYKIEHDNLILGASMTLTNTMEVFYKVSKKRRKFSYLKYMADHIDLVTHVQVRNIGTIAGNLMIKHQHHEFPSDIFLILTTAGAILTIATAEKKEVTKTMEEFLDYDMNRKVIKNVILHDRDDSFKYNSFKIMLRAQNTHAMVNAGYLLQLDRKDIVRYARIVYGLINPKFIHASNTEKFLIGKRLFDNITLQAAFAILHDELKTDLEPPEPSPQFRKKLAIALFYKYVLSVAPDHSISPRNRSGSQKLKRPISHGVQDFNTNKSMYPLTKPIPKIEALAQTSGQAEYIVDIPKFPHQLYGAFVLAKAPANSKIIQTDTSKAMKIDGVVDYFDKNDLTGENSYMSRSNPQYANNEELFCDGVVLYHSQPIGLIVATTQEIAQKAADAVKVAYSPPKTPPLLTIRDILKANAVDRIIKELALVPKTRGNDIRHVIKGTFDLRWQYHYHMELQIAIVVPKEDSFDIITGTQWMDETQNSAAQMLQLPANKFNVAVRRVGGAYGAKITRNNLLSTAAAIAAYKLNKPIWLELPMETNMEALGKRFPCSCDYEVGVNNNGVIQYMKIRSYSDYGKEGGNENVKDLVYNMLTSTYNVDTWDVIINSTRTDTVTGTWMRGPGSTECLAMVESIMEHISLNLNVDPIQMRMNNFKKTKSPLLQYISEHKKWADIERRKQEISKFNKENRWVKKGLAVVPMTFIERIKFQYTTLVSIYQHDGSVAVAHAGIEMEQGINTKVAQVCAYKFGIALDKVSVKPSNNLASANAGYTGVSFTSEAACYGAQQACDILLKRMEPYRKPKQTWEELVKESYRQDVNLSANGSYSKKAPNIANYEIYGVCATEVVVDILTGTHIVTRVDILEDTGSSMNPVIDIGQVEGAFVMGMGYYTTEEIKFDKEGKLLTNRTWNYKPPGAKDIPVDFRIKFPKNSANPVGVFNSKAVGEPPLCMSISLPLAIRHAVASAREEADHSRWYPIDGPSTVENTFLNSLHDYKHYTL